MKGIICYLSLTVLIFSNKIHSIEAQKTSLDTWISTFNSPSPSYPLVIIHKKRTDSSKKPSNSILTSQKTKKKEYCSCCSANGIKYLLVKIGLLKKDVGYEEIK